MFSRELKLPALFYHFNFLDKSMISFRKLLKFFTGNQKQAPNKDQAEYLGKKFRERYHHFRLLLSANRKALESMANIEQALGENKPFAMNYVKSSCTNAAVNVLKMIKSLDRLAPDRYTALYPRFASIRLNIDKILEQNIVEKTGTLIISLDSTDISLADAVGNKMANLGEIKTNMRLNVPPGFTITAGAYELFMQKSGLQPEINRLIQSTDSDDREELYTLSARIRQMILGAEIPVEICEAVKFAWNALEGRAGNRIRAALRSSAQEEDSVFSSFAGQYHSELNVSADSVFDAYKNVISGKYSIHAIAYRLNKGFRDEDISMAVGCLAMVDAKAGGVVYTGNPVDRADDSVFIHAVLGLPKAVVDGAAPSDLFVIDRETMKITKQEINKKDRKFVCYPEEGVCRMEILDKYAKIPSITSGCCIELAKIALKLESYYGVPQDIEWALDPNEKIIILQCRPLQQAGKSRPKKNKSIFLDDPDLISKRGITASPGKASGQAFAAIKSADTLGFPDGGILVIRQALPEWAGLVSRASAILSEHGSHASHLASVAREFNVPAVFGIPLITKLIQTGQNITVDADIPAVWKGLKDLPEPGPVSIKNPIKGSPVYTALEKAGAWITPLALLDPDSPEFRPENCKTLHDITRYIHEKSVHEMFNFGKNNDFPEKSSKQLHFRVPMQWWILDLDNGFSSSIQGKYVKLEQINSVPMLAFWDGFVAIPWDGPPAVDSKGIMSIMFRSTANPALTTGLKSRYAHHNYFMISKDYCNLNSRLGYHFSIMEAMVSQRTSENYIRFQFKGGAADRVRRIKRVGFIRDILEDCGFSITVRQDHLTAGIQAYEKKYMETRLKILGYLSLHTRQLDMIMNRPSQVNYYNKKIRKDIAFILKDF